ncbi:MAG TPA: hypothetical protein VM867_06530 [Xanthobacteraceae bacterium]|nr:hypothetical protein [Xanthobacteraceae bacterium]
MSGVIALATIVLAFVVPAIALCKVVSLASIVWAIAISTVVAGVGFYVASRLIETRSLRSERVDHYLQVSILVVAAGLLWTHMAIQAAPWRERSIEPGVALAIAVLCGVAGAMLLIRRARRLEAARRRQQASDACGASPPRGLHAEQA